MLETTTRVGSVTAVGIASAEQFELLGPKAEHSLYPLMRYLKRTMTDMMVRLAYPDPTELESSAWESERQVTLQRLADLDDFADWCEVEMHRHPDLGDRLAELLDENGYYRPGSVGEGFVRDYGASHPEHRVIAEALLTCDEAQRREESARRRRARAAEEAAR